MDAIDACAKVIRLYRITSVRFGARELARIVALGHRRGAAGGSALDKRVGVSKEPSRSTGSKMRPIGA
jgi:hypothetical protein